MKHWFRLVALAAFLAGAVVAPSLAQDVPEGSQDDGGFLERQIEGLLSGAGRQVIVSGFEGALSSRATLSSMTIADEQGVWLVLRNAELDWNRSALLRGRLEVTSLTAEEILLPRLPQPGQDLPSPEAKPFALPDLPVSIEIGQISVASVFLGAPLLGEEATVSLDGSASLASGEGKARIAIERIDGTAGSLTLAGSYDNGTQALSLDVSLSEPDNGIAATLLGIPGRPALDLSVVGAGRLSDFTADIQMATDGEQRLTGQVRLLAEETGAETPPDRRFEATLGGDLAPVFSPQFRPFFGDAIRLQAAGTRSADGGLDLQQFDLRARSVELAGRLSIDAQGAPQLIDLTGKIESPDGGPVLLPVGNELRVDRLGLEIAFDASRGPDLTAGFTLRAFSAPGAEIANLGLTGTGQIISGPGTGPQAVDAQFDIAAEGIDLSDPGAQRALGEAVSGNVQIAWMRGAPVALKRLAIEGESFSLTGDGDLVTGDDGPVARFDGGLTAADLGAFSGLAGRDLGGAARLDVALTAGLTSRAISIRADGRTTDLAIAQDQFDRAFAGEATLQLGARRDATGTVLDVLAVESAAARLSATARITSNDAAANLDLTVADAARIDPSLSGPATVTASLGGTVTEGFDVTARADAAGAALAFAGRVADVKADTPLVSGALTLDGLVLDRFAAVAKRPLSGTLALRFNGQARTDLSQFDVKGSIEGNGVTTGTPEVDAALRGRARLELDAARVAADAPIQLRLFDVTSDTVTAQASGSYAAGSSDLRLKARVPDLAPFGHGLFGSLKLDANAVEDAAGWAVKADAEAVGATFAYTGRVEGLDSDAPLVSGDLSLAGLDLARLGGVVDRPLAGRLEAQLAGAVRTDLSRFDLTGAITGDGLRTGIPEADAALRGQARIAIDVTQDGPGAPIRIDRLTVDSDTVTAQASGSYTAGSSDLRLKARVPDLAPFGHGLFGSLKLDATAAEDAAGWAVGADAEAVGATFAYAGRVEGLDSDAPVVSGRARLEALDLGRLAGIVGRPLSGTVSASIEGSARTDQGQFDLAADVTGQGVAVGMADVDALLRGALALRLKASKAAPGQPIRIAGLEVSTAALTASASGSYGGGQSNLQVSARLADIAPYAPGIAGPVSASGRIGESAAGISVDLAAEGPGGIRLTVTGSAAQDFSNTNLSISGVAPLAPADRFIAPQSLRGTATFDLALNGKPGLPALSGTLSTQDARLVLPGPGIALNDINATVRLAGGTATLNVTARKQAGGGLSVAGSVGLSGAMPVDLAVQLEDIVVTDPALYETSATGSLALGGAIRTGARATGVITLGTTEIRVPSSGFGSTGAIPDLVHLNQPATVQATRARAGLTGDGGDGGDGGGAGPSVALDVRVVADNRIFVRGRGLDAELGGRLQLSGTTANVIPSGQFDLVRGRLDLLGKRLALTEGQISMRGNFRPYLRLVAQTRANETELFITLEGPASSPTITFSSQPELPEDEVLAQLLFGKSVTDISPLQAARLASAVATLAGRGGDGVIGRLRDEFGLDDLDVTTDADGNAAVRAGAYLSENIYSDVTVSAIGEAEVTLNLDISSSLRARGSVSNSGETSLGIFFERDY